MKLKIDKNVALPDNWQDYSIKGNSGFKPTLRQMAIGESFTFDVTDKKTEKEWSALRVAIYQIRNAKLGRKNFVIRLIDHNEDTNHKVYRVWAAPLSHTVEKQ